VTDKYRGFIQRDDSKVEKNNYFFYQGDPFLSYPENEKCPRRSLSLEYVLINCRDVGEILIRELTAIKTTIRK
jgi:hypothetical protein